MMLQPLVHSSYFDNSWVFGKVDVDNGLGINGCSCSDSGGCKICTTTAGKKADIPNIISVAKGTYH